MKRLFSILVLLIFALSLSAQDSSSVALRKRGDSLIQKIEDEKDPSRRDEFIMRLLSTGTDADPFYTLEVGRRLYTVGEKYNDLLAKGTGWSFYGQGYRLSGNYIKALECHYKAIELAEKSGNQSAIGQAYNQLGHIYKDREEFDRAIELYQRARIASDAGRSEMPKIWPPMNLGGVYLGTGKYDSSLYYSQMAYRRMLQSSTDIWKQYLPYILGNIATAHSKLKKEKEAQDTFHLALSIVSQPGYNHLRQKQLLYSRVAEYFRERGREDSCLYYAKAAIAAVENTVFAYLSTKPARMLSELYEKTNADSAVKYLKLFLKTNEVINSTRVTQQMQMLSFEESQRQLELEQERKDYRARVQIYLLLGGLAVVLLFAGFMLRNNKQKQKANLQLQQQKKELEATLEQLSSTQKQLVHAEKMASLGELTAGIAHEIQNPLNFVNNFSDLNKELAEELKQELATGNWQQAAEIADDIIANEEKINHHGKRADGIVKGMLQHSRSSSGQKEPADLNALCDEYLRLAYHGLRAKDKSFNATFRADLDPALGPVSVLPQDLGRVILNLINNAFYAVNERKKKEPDGYEPEVRVTTKKTGNAVEIRISDNGTGIPKSVIDKIFQPFFTTKPTGEGTGLGLSLSYDIVTKGHGGTLQVASEEGRFTEFIIQLPAEIK